jgi:hypothetical protein
VQASSSEGWVSGVGTRRNSNERARHIMRIVSDLWADECGLVLSAEAVTIGTIGVLGAVVGLNAASSAVDQELKEFASAIRSLDQSYGYVGHQSCRAWAAGSYYRQQDVGQSLQDLCAEGTTDIRAIEKQVDAHRARHLPQAPHPTVEAESEAQPAPNQIPVPEAKAGRTKPQPPVTETPNEAPRRKHKKFRDREDD